MGFSCQVFVLAFGTSYFLLASWMSSQLLQLLVDVSLFYGVMCPVLHWGYCVMHPAL